MKVPFLDIKKQHRAIRGDIIDGVKELVESCSFIGGKYVKEFEDQIADYLGAKHAIGCGNGTDALVLGLRACGVQPGDEVITTSFSFFATAEAIASVGAIPVFVDVLDTSFTIDPKQIEKAITARTKAILPVHIFGLCCDMDEIMAIARKHDLKVIEDAAQAIGSRYKGKYAGTIGDVGCFSFYPTKNLGCCGDGGMCVTNDDDLDVVIRSLREHGAGKMGAKAYEIMTGTAEDMKLSESGNGLYDPYKYYNYLIGYNSRLDAFQALVLSIKLKYLNEYNSRRAEIAAKYTASLTKEVRCPEYEDYKVPCWHQYVILTDKKEALCSYLTEHGIGCGTFYPVPLHEQKAFNAENSVRPDEGNPVSESISKKTVCLPIFPEMTDDEVQAVIGTVNQFFEEG